MMESEKSIRAEVISIGDEMTSGARLDTNSQWISQRLNDIGVHVAFHSTVGDDLNDHTDVLRIAAGRADVVVMTGGIGPTKDDLTRQAMADLAEQELVFHSEVCEHIEKMFERFGREMPENNRIQAYFPAGSKIIPNPEGTAPGIDLTLTRDGGNEKTCRIFALPGVPAEMKQMWQETVEPNILAMSGAETVITHHTIHCFGTGESHTEELLGELTQRGRHPRVGITASSATITLRISARGKTKEEASTAMQPTIATINETLKEYIFGENGSTLAEVVARQLWLQGKTVSIVDCGLDGEVAKALADAESGAKILTGCLQLGNGRHEEWLGQKAFDPELAAQKIGREFNANVAIAVAPIEITDAEFIRGFNRFTILTGGQSRSFEEHFGGHSSWRKIRSVKQVLNRIRLELAKADATGV